ncbi:MAG TPA: AAA family ATPase [Planctomycetota bacterium]|nr:AAA family ATPase [Planctomycetota bacterium]
MIRPAMSAPFVLVSGGKGGVGKTMVAVNLAVQLASEGRRVLLADLDLAMADAHVLVRLSPSSTIKDFLAGRVTARDCIVRAAGGFDLLPAESGDPGLARDDAQRREAILAALAELSVDYDIVLGDSAAGVGPDVLDFAAAADRVLIVTTPDPTALTDAYGCIKALDLHATELGLDLPTPELILNQVDGADQADGLATRLRGVCERFLARSPRLAGWLPRSSLICASIARQRPFALDQPRALENHCMRRLSARVQRWFPAFPTLKPLLKA